MRSVCFPKLWRKEQIFNAPAEVNWSVKLQTRKEQKSLSPFLFTLKPINSPNQKQVGAGLCSTLLFEGKKRATCWLTGPLDVALAASGLSHQQQTSLRPSPDLLVTCLVLCRPPGGMQLAVSVADVLGSAEATPPHAAGWSVNGGYELCVAHVHV